MAKPNTDMTDLSSQQKAQFEVLKGIAAKYPDVSFYRMSGSRKRGFRINLYGEDVMELWCDCPDSPVKNAGYLGTKHIPTDEQSRCIEIQGRDYSSILDDPFSRYLYRKNWGYKWGIWLSSKKHLVQEIENIINSYAMSHNRTLSINDKFKDKRRNSEDEKLFRGEISHPDHTEWIFPCNPKYFDIDGAMHEQGRVDWFSRNKVNPNDTVYIYVGGSTKAIKYKCRAEKVGKDESTIDDLKFGGYEAGTEISCIELALETEYPGPGISYYDLKRHGLKSAIRGPIRVPRILHDYLMSFMDPKKVIKKINEFTVAPEGEERDSLIRRRVNQSWFREALLQKYHGCCLCGVSNKTLLIASHIKPWAVSTPEEKTDINNGLILCPNHDRLFDNGYISFKNNGDIMISNKITKQDCEKMGIKTKMKIDVAKEMVPFLEYHRENVFVDGNDDA